MNRKTLGVSVTLGSALLATACAVGVEEPSDGAIAAFAGDGAASAAGEAGSLDGSTTAPIDPTRVGINGSLVGVDASVDSDADGLPDVEEGTGDADADGVPAHLDADEFGVGGGGSTLGGGTGSSAGDAGQKPSSDPPPAGCDIRGSWGVAQFTVSSAAGFSQTTVNYLVMELDQSGEAVTVTDSLRCGFEIPQGYGTTSVTLTDPTIQGIAINTSGGGRTGSYVPNSSGGCSFALDKTYTVYGVSSPYFADNPDLPLPSDWAAAGEPGVEDWDGDGNRGIAISAGTGQRHVAMRDWTQYHGDTDANVGDRFRVLLNWDSEEVVMPETSFASGFASMKDSSAEHRVWFVRLPGDGSVKQSDPLKTCANLKGHVSDLLATEAP